MTIADEVNAEILNLWYTPAYGLAGRQPRMPRVYPALSQGGLLTVGHNPSFSDKAFRDFLHDAEWTTFDPHTFYAWKEKPDEFDIVRACAIEQLALDRYDHYQPFSQIAAKLGTHWNYIDLFLIRETKDKLVRPQVIRGGASKWGVEALNPFGRAQVDLCVRLIMKLQPKLMIVANAAASHILKVALDAAFDASHGYHTTRIGEGTVPVFFSSMWTGQRALDVFSRERLRWQIERAFQEARPSHLLS